MMTSKVSKMILRRRTEEDLYNSVPQDCFWYVRRDQEGKMGFDVFLSVKYVYRISGEWTEQMI